MMKSTQMNSKIWRESASLILAAKSNFCKSSNFNYKLLCLQRSSGSKVMANSYVFPGGNTSDSDRSSSWIKLFEKFGYNLESLKQIYPVKNVPPIIRNDNEGHLPKYLSLRICAIRETFEECGLLICRSRKVNYNQNVTEWASFIGGNEIIKWQKIVHDDPYQFLNLCTQLDACPDVWSLHNWSNWVTPPRMLALFNTMFFFSAFNQVPSLHREEKEIQNIRWAIPDAYIEENQCEKILLPTPQFYEISRLRNFHDIGSLVAYAKERSSQGCEKYFPHRIKTKRGVYYIFPGDELYEEEMEANKTSLLDDLPQSERQNRLLLNGPNIQKLFVNNFFPKDGHLPPKA